MLLSKVLLDGIVDALDDHVLKPRPLQQVGHRWGVPEWVHSPANTRLHTWTEGGVTYGGTLAASQPERKPGNTNPGVSAATGVPPSADPTSQSSESWLHRSSPTRPSPSPAAPSSANCPMAEQNQETKAFRRKQQHEKQQRRGNQKRFAHLLTIARFCSSMSSHHFEKKLISAQIIVLLAKTLCHPSGSLPTSDVSIPSPYLLSALSFATILSRM